MLSKYVRVDRIVLRLALRIMNQAGRQMHMSSIRLDTRCRLTDTRLLQLVSIPHQTLSLTNLLVRNSHILVKLGLEDLDALQRRRELGSSQSRQSKEPNLGQHVKSRLLPLQRQTTEQRRRVEKEKRKSQPNSALS